MYPTLLIGIGPSGAYELRLLKKRLLKIGGNELPKGVRLRWIGTDDSVEEGLDEVDLQPFEKLMIQPDYHNFEQMDLMDGHADFDWWYKGKNFDQTSRADGRLAFFWASQLVQKQEFANWLMGVEKDLVFPPMNQFRIFIFTSLAEKDSAMVFDLAFELRARFSGRVEIVLPFFSFTSGKSVEQENLKDYKSFRRELERLMLNKPKVIDHGEKTPTIVNHPVFDNMIFFDKSSSFPLIADQVVSLLEEEVTHAVNYQLMAANDLEELSFAVMESYTLYTPMAEIQSYCAARLLKEGLFSSVYGEQNYGLLPLKQQGSQFTFTKYNYDLRETVLDFFEGEYGDYSLFWKAVALLLRGGNQNQDMSLPDEKIITRLFRLRLYAYLKKYFDDAGLRHGADPFSWAEAVLSQIDGLINSSEIGFRLRKKMKGNLLACLFLNNQTNFTNILSEIRKVILDWKLNISNQTAKLTFEEYDQKNKRLKNSAQSTSGRRCIFDADRIQEIADCIYERFLQSIQGKRVVDQFAGKSGWFWSEDNGSTGLRWKIGDQIYRSNQSEEIVRAWQVETEYWMRTLDTDLAMDRQFQRLSAQEKNLLLNEVHPENPLKYVAGSNFQESYFMTGYDSEYSGYLRQWAETAQGLYSQHVISTQDHERICFIHFKSNLPLRGIKHFSDQYAVGNNATDSMFNAEQNAYEIESEIQQKFNWIRLNPGKKDDPYLVKRPEFSPDFVRLMWNKEAFKLVMELIFYHQIYSKKSEVGNLNWFVNVPNSQIQTFALFTNSYLSGNNDLENALEQFLINLPYGANDRSHPLYHQRIKETLNELSDVIENVRVTWNEELKNENWACIEAWRRSEKRFEKDLAVYQTYLMYTL